MLRTGASSSTALDHLTASLARLPDGGSSLVEPWFDQAKAQLSLHRWQQAEATLRGLLARPAGAPAEIGSPDEDARALAHEWLGLALAGQGEHTAAEAELRPLLDREPNRPELWFNLGRIVLGQGRAAEAEPLLRRAVELRPNLEAGWLHLGRALARLDRPDEAATALRRCLSIEPSEHRATRALEQLAAARGTAPGAGSDDPDGPDETDPAQDGPRR